MTISVNTALEAFCDALVTTYGNRCLNYGEATESLVDGQGGNYITIDGQRFCSVNDNYDVVVFATKLNSAPAQQQGGGRMNALYRNTNFKLAVNCKSASEEFVIATILNSTTGITYMGTSFEGRSIASEYFGLDERNYQTTFFTCDFNAIEKITCQPC
jgi:hypothetical protein